MFKMNYALIVFAVFVIAAGQIMFKYAAKRIVVTDPFLLGSAIRLNLVPIAVIALALSLYVVSTIAWVQALRTIPLSVAFMFNSIAFLLVPSAGFFIFGEAVPRFFLPALVMILGGIFLVTRG